MPLCFIIVRGVDYEAADPLLATFTQGSVLNDTMDVIVTILNDETVEGQHQFTAAVENVSPVIAGPAATIVIMDNDSEYTCLYVYNATAVCAVDVPTCTYIQLLHVYIGRIIILFRLLSVLIEMCA